MSTPGAYRIGDGPLPRHAIRSPGPFSPQHRAVHQGAGGTQTPRRQFAIKVDPRRTPLNQLGSAGGSSEKKTAAAAAPGRYEIPKGGRVPQAGEWLTGGAAPEAPGDSLTLPPKVRDRVRWNPWKHLRESKVKLELTVGLPQAPRAQWQQIGHSTTLSVGAAAVCLLGAADYARAPGTAAAAFLGGLIFTWCFRRVYVNLAMTAFVKAVAALMVLFGCCAAHNILEPLLFLPLVLQATQAQPDMDVSLPAFLLIAVLPAAAVAGLSADVSLAAALGLQVVMDLRVVIGPGELGIK